MVTEPVSAGCSLEPLGVAPAPAETVDVSSWRAYHLFYHGDRNVVLTHLVRPVVGRLMARGEIDRFYFVRYALGGPHVRLRWRVTGDADRVETEFKEASEQFFRSSPSTSSLPEDEVLRRNKSFLTDDPLAEAEEDRAFPDNSLATLPVRFEVERYGGAELLPHSLDYFTFSSIRSLQLLESAQGPAPGRWLSQALRLTIRQAWGLAGSPEDFFHLAGYAIRFMGDALPACIEQGDRVFEERRSTLSVLLREELLALSPDEGEAGAAPRPTFAAAARALAGRIRSLPEEERWFLGASQIHMTSNRLGIFNPEEVYLCRMLWRAARELATSEPDFWRRRWQIRHQRWSGLADVEDLLPALLEPWCGGWREGRRGDG